MNIYIKELRKRVLQKKGKKTVNNGKAIYILSGDNAENTK